MARIARVAKNYPRTIYAGNRRSAMVAYSQMDPSGRREPPSRTGGHTFAKTVENRSDSTGTGSSRPVRQTRQVSRNKHCSLREMPVLLPTDDLCDITVELQIHTSINVIKSIRCRSPIENCSDILYICIYIFLYCFVLCNCVIVL